MLFTVTDPVPHCPALHPEVTVSGERLESPSAENGSLKKSGGFCPSSHWNYKEFGNVVGGSREEMALGIFSQRARQIAPPWYPNPLFAQQSQTLTLDACTLPKGRRGSGTKGRTKGSRNWGQNLWTPQWKPIMTIILGKRKWWNRETEIFQKILW